MEAGVVSPRYESYKPAKSPWIQEVPSHWKLLPGFAVLKANKDKNIGMIEKVVLSLSYGKVIIKPPEKLTGLVPESFETYQIINPNDIIIRPTDLQNDHISLRTGLAKDRGIITSAYICLRPDPSHNPVFMYYLLHAYDLLKVYYGMGSGLRQNLDYGDFKRLEFCIPPRDEQDRIANFLDQKTAEIDAAIAKKQHLIELLKEQKAILINQAVTKGLNPDTPMRDSGVEWIGEVPEHWSFPQFRYCCSVIKDGLHHTPAKYQEGVNFVSTQHVRNRRINTDNATFISVKAYKEGHPRVRPETGDVLITLVGSIGFAALVQESHLPLSFTRHVGYVRCDKRKLNQQYLINYTESHIFKCFIEKNVSQTAQPSIYLSCLSAHKIPLPPLDEQQEIVNRISIETSPYDQAIDQAQEEILKLEEFKKVVISEAVTGKIKL